MSTFNEDIEQVRQACHDMSDLAWAAIEPTLIRRGLVWALQKRDDALEDMDVYPPCAVVALTVLLGVAFVVFWCWTMRGMQW